LFFSNFSPKFEIALGYLTIFENAISLFSPNTVGKEQLILESFLKVVEKSLNCIESLKT